MDNDKKTLKYDVDNIFLESKYRTFIPRKEWNLDPSPLKHFIEKYFSTVDLQQFVGTQLQHQVEVGKLEVKIKEKQVGYMQNLYEQIGKIGHSTIK